MIDYVKSEQMNNKETKLIRITQSIQSYIQSQSTFDVNKVIYTYPNVVQKSYGQEKRFFCPAPQLYIKGSYKNYTANCYIVGSSKIFFNDNDSTNVYKDMNYLMNSAIECSNNSVQLREIQCYNSVFENDDICTFNTIHFNDDQQRYIRIIIQVLRKDASILGTFVSEHIKVISKPSKKKNVTTRNSEMLIKSFSPVVLFSRVRTHAYNTRYLSAEEDNFVSVSNRWSSLLINLVSSNRLNNLQNSKEDMIAYGDTIKLICPHSGLTLPDIIIHKIESYSVIKIPNENLSQLHRIALAIKGEKNTFLSIEEDMIRKREILPGTDGEIELPESACWSIVTTGKYESLYITPIGFTESITPLPKISKIEESGFYRKTLEISGENFSPDMIIFMSDIPLETSFVAKNMLACVIHENFLQALRSAYRKNCKFFIVKSNGTIYPTGIEYKYLD